MKKSGMILAVLLIATTGAVGCAAVASVAGAHTGLAVVLSILTGTLAALFSNELGKLHKRSA